MKNRGLYGQDEGNGSRGNAAVMEDIGLENEIAEGEWERKMSCAARKGQLKRMATLRDEMKAEAVRAGCDPSKAQERADSTLRRAMVNLRV